MQSFVDPVSFPLEQRSRRDAQRPLASDWPSHWAHAWHLTGATPSPLSNGHRAEIAGNSRHDGPPTRTDAQSHAALFGQRDGADAGVDARTEIEALDADAQAASSRHHTEEDNHQQWQAPTKNEDEMVLRLPSSATLNDGANTSLLLDLAPGETSGVVMSDIVSPTSVLFDGFDIKSDASLDWWKSFSASWTSVLGVGVGVWAFHHQLTHETKPATTQDASVTFTINGGLLAGPITNPSLKITAYDAQGHVLGSTANQLSDGTDVGDYGYYTLTLRYPGFTAGAVLLRVTDPTSGNHNDYIDEATGVATDIADMRAVIYLQAPQAATSANPSTTANANANSHASITAPPVTAYITPLTTLAAELVAPLSKTGDGLWTLPTGVTQAQIAQANQQVATLFGLDAGSDVTSLQPLAVISSQSTINPDSNAYGKALAVLSLAQADHPGLTVQKLADDLKSTMATPAGLKFSPDVAPQLQVASLKAVTKNFLSTADAYQLQQSTTDGTSPSSIDFQFVKPTLTLATLDPAHALGREVYHVQQLTTARLQNSPLQDNALQVFNVNTTASGRFRMELLDTVVGSQDAQAFSWNPVAGSLVLKADAAPQVQGAGGHTYRVTLRATADLLNTPDDVSDDIAVTQALTLTVQDTTAPAAPSPYTITFNSLAGVQAPSTAIGSTTLVGTDAILNPAGFLTLSNLLQPGDPGVRDQVHLTLLNALTHHSISRDWSDWFGVAESSRQVVLTANDVSHLGDGTITVQATVKAEDLAGLISSAVTSTASFVLDTVVSTPAISMLNYPDSYTSGDGWLRLDGLEEGASYSCTVFRGADVNADAVVYARTDTVYRYIPNASSDTITTRGTVALDLHALGSGDYTLQVIQHDVLGNSRSVTQSFTLVLDPPLGVDASIDAFVLAQSNGQMTSLSDLMYLDGTGSGWLSGTWKGHLSDNETLQLGVGRREQDGSVTWQWGDNLFNQLLPDEAGNHSWNVDSQGDAHWRVELPSTLNGNALLGVRLVDSLGHANLLTTRHYVFQTDEVLLPPTIVWSDAPVGTTDTTDTTLKFLVAGLAAHAQAQYQLTRSATPPAKDDVRWSNALPQPWNDGSNADLWYLYVRQQDILTGQVSAVADPLVIHLDTSAPAPIVGLLYGPVDAGRANSDVPLLSSMTRAQVTAQSAELETGRLDANGHPLYQGQTLTVLGNWTDSDDGATLSVRWGHVLKLHVLSLDDIHNQRVDLGWSTDEILNQPGQVTVQAWTTDLAGQASAVYSRSFVVDPREAAAAIAQTAPTFLGLFTHANSQDSYIADVDNTINKAQAQSGVRLKLQLARKQANGTDIDWSNGFKLMLFAKTPSDNWSSTSITTGTLPAGSEGNAGMSWDRSTGQVDWTLNLNNPLGNSLFSSMQGSLRDWKVQILNFAYGASSPLYLSETALAELKIDTLAPGSLTSTSVGNMTLSVGTEGVRVVTLGQQQTVLKVWVNYSGMAIGDVIELFAQKADAASPATLVHYQLKATDFTGTQAVLTLSRDTLTQGQGDGSYSMGLTVTDTAGNSSTLAANRQVTVKVDTQGPAAPTLSFPATDPQQPNLHDAFLNAAETSTDLNITWAADHVDSDNLHWVLGGMDLSDALVNQYIQVKQVNTSNGVTTTTYTLDKRVFGAVDGEGVKDLRVNLVDASGNLGSYSNVLTLVLDSQPHEAPVVSVRPSAGTTTGVITPWFLARGASVQLNIVDAQSVTGETLHLTVTREGAGNATWDRDFNITDPLQTIWTLQQSGQWTWAGQAGVMSQLLGQEGLTSGEYLITATVTDLAGNVSPRSQPYRVVVDLDAPVNEVLAGSVQFAQHAVIDATASQVHHRAYITREPHQIVTLHLETALQTAAALTGAETLWGRVVAPDEVTNEATSHEEWINLSSDVVGDTLTWNTGDSGLTLVEGVNVIQFQVRDAAGNRGAITTQQYVLDTLAPTTTVRAGTLTFSNDSAPTTGQGTPTALGLNHDLQTNQAQQILSLDLSAALRTDTDNSATWGSAQEHLWASLNNGTTWFDVTSFVQGNHLTWQLANTRNSVTGALSPLTLTESNTVQFRVMDVAGNSGPTLSQAYVLDTQAPTAQATRLEFVSDTGMGDAEALSHHDFITNQARTSLNLSFNHPLSMGDHVYVSLDRGDAGQIYDITTDLRQLGAYDAVSWSLGTPVFNVGSDTSAGVDNRFTLVNGSHTVSVWVEDAVGNTGAVLDQAYVYAAQAPQITLAGMHGATSGTWRVSATTAQRGVVLGEYFTVGALTTDVAEVVLNVLTPNSDNGSNERMQIAPGVDVDLNSAAPTALTGLHIAGMPGTVQWTPYGGGEVHLTRQDALGQMAYFTASEVQSLLGGMRYFNTANSDDITPGNRSISVQLVDRATNTSTPLVATLSVMAVTEAEMTGSANAQDNIVTGTSADDVLFGLQGNDTLAGNGGNNLFLWMAGDAQSSTGGPVTDVISDFHGWNPLTQTGDRLDISRLLEGLSRQSAWGNYVSVDNHATVAGVTNSTRLTVHVNGTSPGATQVIELPGVTLGTPGESAAALLQELVSTQQLKVL